MRQLRGQRRCTGDRRGHHPCAITERISGGIDEVDGEWPPVERILPPDGLQRATGIVAGLRPDSVRQHISTPVHREVKPARLRPEDVQRLGTEQPQFELDLFLQRSRVEHGQFLHGEPDRAQVLVGGSAGGTAAVSRILECPRASQTILGDIDHQQVLPVFEFTAGVVGHVPVSQHHVERFGWFELLLEVLHLAIERQAVVQHDQPIAGDHMHQCPAGIVELHLGNRLTGVLDVGADGEQVADSQYAVAVLNTVRRQGEGEWSP